MNLPYFPLRVNEWLNNPAILALSLEQQGAAMRLMALMWQAPDGSCSLPNDDNLLARSLGVSPKKWRVLKKRLVGSDDHCFMVESKDAVRCPYLEELFYEAKAKSIKASESARKSHEPGVRTAKAPRSQSERSANALRTQSERSAPEIETLSTSPSDSPKEKKTPTPPSLAVGSGTRGAKYPDDFERFWSAYPRHEDKQDALKAWRKRVKEGVDPDAMIAAAAAYARQLRAKGKGSDFVKLGATFLNKGSYENYGTDARAAPSFDDRPLYPSMSAIKRREEARAPCDTQSSDGSRLPSEAPKSAAT